MKWNLDVTHSQVEFAVKHMMISTVRGRFASITGTGETSPTGALTAVTLEADVKSIDTNQAQRDEHLRSADFFDVAAFPKMTFVSTEIVQTGSEITITGNLTLKDVTKPVTLKGEFSAPITDPWGNTRAALGVTGKLNRKDFGLVWNMALETGGLVVSEEVKLAIEVEATAVVEAAEVAAV
jgi:polyisoprenoid-binding protein YceI